MYGFTGKILRVDLTNQVITTLNTEDYEEWIGGHGIATAVFFDLVKDKTVGCFDPGNTLVLMTGLFSGTLVPGSSRMELVGIQSQSYPIEWFGRSNCGGRFPAMLKFAGYDGIVIEGAADRPTRLQERTYRGLSGAGEPRIQRAGGLRPQTSGTSFPVPATLVPEYLLARRTADARRPLPF